jgi:hypothetical protein
MPIVDVRKRAKSLANDFCSHSSWRVRRVEFCQVLLCHQQHWNAQNFKDSLTFRKLGPYAAERESGEFYLLIFSCAMEVMELSSASLENEPRSSRGAVGCVAAFSKKTRKKSTEKHFVNSAAGAKGRVSRRLLCPAAARLFPSSPPPRRLLPRCPPRPAPCTQRLHLLLKYFTFLE